MLLTISFVFLLTTIPMNITIIFTKFIDVNNNEKVAIFRFVYIIIDIYFQNKVKLINYRLIRTIAELMMYSNHALNFFLYCATGQKFRQQLVSLINYFIFILL